MKQYSYDLPTYLKKKMFLHIGRYLQNKLKNRYIIITFSIQIILQLYEYIDININKMKTFILPMYYLLPT